MTVPLHDVSRTDDIPTRHGPALLTYTDEQWDTLRALVTFACADAMAAEANLIEANRLYAAERRRNAVARLVLEGVDPSEVMG